LGGPNLKVIQTDSGSPLRAGTAWLWEKGRQEEPFAYYATMRGAGLNAVRLILFDTWEKEAGYGTTDWNDPVYRARALGRIQRAVDYCSVNGMYVIINSHNKIPLFNEAYNNALWTQVAPYFKNRTHVIYEALNETVSGTGTNAAGEYGDDINRLKAMRVNFDIIRAGAPDTHIMVLTPAGVSGWGYVDGMARLTRKFEQQPGRPIDWTKTSVAYHLYHADENLFPLAQNLRNFHSQYAGWPSENNFPPGVTAEQLGIDPGDNWRSVSFGTDLYVNQTCERFGLGWSQWQINGVDQFKRNFPLVWADAVTKGYAWQSDLVHNPIGMINAGAGAVSRFAEDVNFFGGEIANNNPTGAVDLSRVRNAAPVDVYRAERWGDFSYQLARLDPNRRYGIRLHFTESWSGISGPGQRTFDVRANGQLVLNDFDIFATAGNKRNRAVVKEIAAVSDAAGRIKLSFRSVVQNAKVDAIEILGRSETQRQ